ncbi:unnamed protein product [Caenorhabditis auriculariae]|uniref:Uncharacterized protein n=1 Tax=Caenorhabditis auriculariae TaxID=2777116 RepID=A0A8S1GUP8_9PELO|nr:unnamed protein product [Caenorhabditis auriculariae]
MDSTATKAVKPDANMAKKRRVSGYVPMRATVQAEGNNNLMDLQDGSYSDRSLASRRLDKKRMNLPLIVQMMMNTGPGFMTPAFYPLNKSHEDDVFESADSSDANKT